MDVFYRYTSIQKLTRHLQLQHAKTSDSTSLEFESFKYFLAWKEKEECETHSSYVQQCAPQQLNGKEFWYFYCHRAGKYCQKGRGERSMKGQGSSKTVRHCSAHIKAIKDLKTGRVTVNYTYTHYNHKTQLGHLRIPQATRRVIASKLKSGITAQRIIDDIRDSETNHISREHLVSKKDISNIKNSIILKGLEGIQMT